MYKHLLVPVDGSALSHRAMDGSIELAMQLGARITGFVVEPELPLSVADRNAEKFMANIHDHETMNEEHSKALLTQFEARAAAAGVSFAGVSVTSSSVDRVIADEAEKIGCDMIVIVTHGRGQLGEFVFGSHAKHLISLTKLPVLVLH
jgi:nucleotide-binding universal stress UspA family protein